MGGGGSPENMVLQRSLESGSFPQSRSMMLCGRLGTSQETYMFFRRPHTTTGSEATGRTAAPSHILVAKAAIREQDRPPE